MLKPLRDNVLQELHCGAIGLLGLLSIEEVRFLRGAPPMKTLPIVLSALVLGCQQPDTGGEAADTTRAPIGPGSEESVLVPPDTPMTRSGARTVPDTTPPRRDTIR